MTFQSIPNCVEVHINARQDGVPVVNRLFVKINGAPTEGDLDTVSVAIDNWITAFLAPQMTNQMNFENIVVKNVHVANGQLKIYPITTPTGGRSATAAVNSAASVCSLRTALTGKNFRGRFYLGGLCTNDFVNSTTISQSTANSHAAGMADLVDSLEVLEFALVVVSKVLNGIQRAVAVVTEITTIITNTTCDNQRRRTAN